MFRLSRSATQRRRLTASSGIAGVMALALSACGGGNPPPVAPDSVTQVGNSPAISAGMNMSTAADPNATPHLPPADPVIATRVGNVVTVNLTTEPKDIEIAPGVIFHAWTFSGHVPGPVIRVTEGDTVKVSVTNADPTGMGHSIDFHAAQLAPNLDYTEIPAGTTKSFSFVASHPGIFMYHCGSPMVIQHMANGMYGAIIVDPRGGRPAAREYALVQSEFYTGPTAVQDMGADKPTYVVFNGYANHYKLQPLTAKPGELVRLYVVDAGPNRWSAFHVVGALFSSVQASGNPANQLQWVQTATVAPGDGAVFELTMPDPGSYAIVTHSFADVGLGALGIIKVSSAAPDQPLLP
jgi:nitrite reductase (NO-forming)